MKAISLWQPWATLVAVGAKRIETRGWPTRYRGPLAIQAAKRWNGELRDLCFQEPFRTTLLRALGAISAKASVGAKLFDELPRGAVVARANLIDCVPIRPGRRVRAARGTVVPPYDGSAEHAFGDYSDGRYAWILADVVALPAPVPVRGRQQLWTLAPDEAEAVHQQFTEALRHG